MTQMPRTPICVLASAAPAQNASASSAAEAMPSVLDTAGMTPTRTPHWNGSACCAETPGAEAHGHSRCRVIGLTIRRLLRTRSCAFAAVLSGWFPVTAVKAVVKVESPVQADSLPVCDAVAAVRRLEISALLPASVLPSLVGVVDDPRELGGGRLARKQVRLLGRMAAACCTSATGGIAGRLHGTEVGWVRQKYGPRDRISVIVRRTRSSLSREWPPITAG